nr:DUF4190 domain-containing protein [uncultured Microbacterium sp.]
MSDDSTPSQYPQYPSYSPPPPPPPQQPYAQVQPVQAYPGALPSTAPVHPAGQGYAPPAAYPQYAAPYYPPARPASGAAITSLICGIAGAALFWLLIPILGSVVAVITGHMALRQTRADPSVGGRGMAFAGLILGYIVIGLTVVSIVFSLISLLLLGAVTLPFLNRY